MINTTEKNSIRIWDLFFVSLSSKTSLCKVNSVVQLVYYIEKLVFFVYLNVCLTFRTTIVKHVLKLSIFFCIFWPKSTFSSYLMDMFAIFLMQPTRKSIIKAALIENWRKIVDFYFNNSIFDPKMPFNAFNEHIYYKMLS